MSIFPKRTIPGNAVTIHWNVTLPAGMDKPVCPFVRIGIIDPAGVTHLLLEQHVLLLPSTAAPAPLGMQQSGLPQYLHKHTPLLVLANYLGTAPAREHLVNMLTNIHNGRHYYFTWAVPPNALPGKYKLLSELLIDGVLKQSGTASDDLFYVEQINVIHEANGKAIVYNPGPEPVPVKLISYSKQQQLSMEICQLPPGEQRVVPTTNSAVFLVYNEERITVPLHTTAPRLLRNQQHLVLRKEEAGEPVTYVLPREGEHAYRLTGYQRNLWEAANGTCSLVELKDQQPAAYDEMIANGLLIELP